MDWERQNDYLLRVPKTGPMKTDAYIFAKEGIKIEESAVGQLRDAASLPSVEHALGMPDIHQGYGVPIGSVVATSEVIVPAAVGYDINCGMRMILTSRHAADTDLAGLAENISREIPLGEGKKNISLSKSDFALVLEGGLSALPSLRHKNHEVWEALGPKEHTSAVEDGGSMDGILDAVTPRAIERGINQLGTLGGGNHFIELQQVQKIYDTEKAQRLGIFSGQMSIMIHSGSRGFGHEVGGHYMKAAKKYNDQHGGSSGPHPSFLPAHAKEGINYLGAMHAAANFAFANRALMGALVEMSVRKRYPGIRMWLLYDVPHNIVKLERHGGRTLWVHRKGGTRAFDGKRMRGTPFADLGQPVLIPGSMGTASYILTGMASGEKSLFSVNHGAGRVMSRTAASGGRRGKKKKRVAQITDEQFQRSMKGVHLIAADKRSVKEEAPGAYKDIDKVIETVAEAGLAVPVARLVPKAVLKG